MLYQVVLIQPPGYPHTAALMEVGETLIHGLRALGLPTALATNMFAPEGLNIVLGAHLLAGRNVELLPDNVALYNLEQIEPALFERYPQLSTLYGRHEVWDYSQRNIEQLRPLNPRLYHLPVGTMPEMTRIPAAPRQDIDVLFYGSANERRKVVLRQIAASGLKLSAVFGVYGTQRDALIARSKVVLNLHQHEAQVFEVVRVSYLLSNHKAVVTELSPDTEIEAGLADAVAGAPYDQLAERCRQLVADDRLRRRQEKKGFGIMTARQQSTYLRRLLDERGRHAAP